MKKIFVFLFLAMLLPLTAWAASFTMEGDYVKTAVSDNGTLGYGREISPGIQHDETGSGSFGIDDYLTPGDPWELFAISSDQTGNRVNNNNSGSTGDISGSITNTSSPTYDQFVRWEGGYSDSFDFEQDTFFNNGDERISFAATITAKEELTNLTFLRSLDPDPDVKTFGSFITTNGRGYDANDDGDFNDAEDISPQHWVHSQGENTGLTIGLFSDSDYTHNTGISSAWTTDASFYLDGNNNGNGDYTIGLAFDFGSLASGESATFSYAYIMGDTLATVDIPGKPPVSVPEPASLLLLGSGLAGLAVFRRKKIKN